MRIICNSGSDLQLIGNCCVFSNMVYEALIAYQPFEPLRRNHRNNNAEKSETYMLLYDLMASNNYFWKCSRTGTHLL